MCVCACAHAIGSPVTAFHINHAAVCNPSCLNGGRCTAPNVCQCTSDWEGDYCQNGKTMIPIYKLGGTCLDRAIHSFIFLQLSAFVQVDV